MAVKLQVGKCYRTESGVKVGPMKYNNDNSLYCLVEGMSRVFFTNTGLHKFGEKGLDLVDEWSDAPYPIRTVTKKEIVSGQYGIVNVDVDRPTENPRIVVSAVPTVLELTKAIETLIIIRDAMQEGLK